MATQQLLERCNLVRQKTTPPLLVNVFNLPLISMVINFFIKNLMILNFRAQSGVRKTALKINVTVTFKYKAAIGKIRR